MKYQTVCPYCESPNILSLSPQALILGGVGGVAGGLLGAFFTTKTPLLPKSNMVSTLVFGILSGMGVGYRIGRSIGRNHGESAEHCFCLDCFQFFHTRESVLEDIPPISGYPLE